MESQIWSLYIHINKINNKKYIGITSRKKSSYRWGAKGDRYSTSPHFYNAIKKYGWENFNHEIILINLTQEEAIRLEKEYIKKYNSNNKLYGYNLTTGGEGTQGYKLSAKNIERLRKLNTGNKYSLGHQVSDESKLIMRNCKLGKKQNQLFIDKRAKANTNGKKSKKVYQYSKEFKTIKVWISLNEARRNGYSAPCISRCCNNTRYVYKDFVWSFKKMNRKQVESRFEKTVCYLNKNNTQQLKII